MGLSLSWLAVRGGTRESVLGTLGLRWTGLREEIQESEITGVELPTGWYIVANSRDYPSFMNDRTLAQLSTSAEVITCFLEEHIMCSSAEGWQSGRRVWLLLHDGQRSIEHLEMKGNFPPIFADIHNRLRAEQDAAGGRKAPIDHIFDIPLELAEAITGYRHDREIPELGDTPFEVLAMTAASPRRSWLRRLLGV